MADTRQHSAFPPFAANPGKTNCNPTDIGFFALIREDFVTHGHEAFNQGFWAVFWHRFGNWRMGLRWKILRAPMTVIYRIMFKMVEWVCGIHLPYTVRLGRRVKLEHFGGMILVASSIGNDVILRQNTTIGVARITDLCNRPVIEDGVDIGAGAVIIGPVRIGTGALIGANAVVVQDVPQGATAVGVPARIKGAAAPEISAQYPLP